MINIKDFNPKKDLEEFLKPYGEKALSDFRDKVTQDLKRISERHKSLLKDSENFRLQLITIAGGTISIFVALQGNFDVSLLTKLGFAGLGVFYLYKPYREVDDIIVSCDNGLTFRAKEEGIYLFSEYVSNEEKCRLREICGRPPLIYKTHGKEFPYTCDNLPESISLDDLMKHTKDNYKIEYVYKTIGGWEKAIFYAVVTTFLLTVLSIVLEKTIVYILSGGNWWKL